MDKTSRELSAVFVGEESLVLSCVDVWLERGHVVTAIVSDIPFIRDWAAERSLPIFSVAEITRLQQDEPFDYLFSIVNFRILPDDVVAMARRAAINFHDSPLPRYAGVNATNWAIINGEPEHGISWHVMVDEIDAGAVLEQRVFPIKPDETAITLNARCYEEALDGFGVLTDRLTDDSAFPTEQNLEERTYFGRWLRPKAAGIIDWGCPAHEISSLVRGLDHGSYYNPLGSAKVLLGDRVVAVKGVAVGDSDAGKEPGTILDAGPAGFTVAVPGESIHVLAVETLAGELKIPARVLAEAGYSVGDRLPSLDAAAAQALAEAASAFAPKERYWIERLVGLELLPPPYVSSARSANSIESFRSRRISVPPEFLRALNARGIDAADGLTTAFLMYLARIHDQVEFDVGYRSAATSPPSGSEQIFAAYSPLRFSCRGTESLAALVETFQVARDSLEPNLTYALDLAGRAPRLRDAGGPFAAPVAIERGEDDAAEPPPQADLVARIPNDGVELILFFDPAVVSEQDAGRVHAQLTSVLASLAVEPDQPMGEVETLPEAERTQLLREWNPPVGDYQLAPSLAAAFEAQVAENPDRVALTYLDEHVTYGEFNRRANRVARALIDRGAGPDVLVGLAMERSLDLLVGLVAILKSGSAYLPLDPSYPAERVRYMVEHAKAPVILTQKHLASDLPESPALMVLIDDIESNGVDEDNPGAASSPDSLAYVMYTSGSTGRPKGVQITHRNVLRLMEATRPWFEFGPQDVWTLFHSYAFDFTVWEIWGALLFGGRLVIPSHETTRSPSDFLQLVASEQVTVLNQTPSAFRQLIEADGLADGTPELALRYVVFGGEALDLADLRPWTDRHGADKPVLVNMYGITETTVHVTYRPLTADDIEQNLGSVIGVPIPDLQIHVLDRWMQLTPIGMPGEVYVGGAGLARGYLNRMDLTSERFVPNPFVSSQEARLYKTGDVARYLASGDLEYLGRADQQVQLRGFRIELGEIEAVLAAHESVSKVIVDVKELGPDDKRLIAYYLTASKPVEPAVLKELAAGSLPEYMVPHHFVSLETVPLTPSGKLDRKALPLPSSPRVEAPAAPGSDAERRIAAIWRQVLSLDEVGVRDTFFDLGGHSLLVMKLAGRLAAQFERAVSVADIFRFPTIEGQARFVTDSEHHDQVVAGVDEAARKQRRALRQQQQRATRRRPGGSQA